MARFMLYPLTRDDVPPRRKRIDIVLDCGELVFHGMILFWIKNWRFSESSQN
jgi:hypothetical protein